jgi:fructokinase
VKNPNLNSFSYLQLSSKIVIYNDIWVLLRNFMKKITSVGEILFDVYPEGKKLGGAPFNFIYHIIKLTGKANFVSRIGNDPDGDEILQILKDKNISTEFIQIDQKHKTGIAKTILNDKKIPTFIIEKDRAYDFIELTEPLEKLISQDTDCLYYGTLAQRDELSRETIQNLSGRKVKCICDLNIRQDFYSFDVIEKSLSAADVLKLNEDELKLVNKLVLKIEYNPVATARKLLDVFNIELLCVTKGSAGAVLYKGREESFYKISNEKVVDTVGAGDAYASLLCLGYLNNWHIDKINKLASEFANEIVKVEGALPEDDTVYESFKKIMFNEDG